MENLASIMIKLADEETGSVDGKRIQKEMTALDHERMNRAVEQSREILVRLGVPEEKQFSGTLNAGHPGGMLPLTAAEKDTLHHPSLPDNLYVADATDPDDHGTGQKNIRHSFTYGSSRRRWPLS